MSTKAKPPPSKSKINKLEVNKAKRGIYNNANAGNSGGPVIDVKAWKAAQKAAAAGAAGAADPGEEAKKAERQKRFAGGAAAAACDTSAKMALDTVKKSDKKGEVVKGFVSQLTAGGKEKQGGGGGGGAPAGGGKEGVSPVAAVPQGMRRDGTKPPKVLLNEFCSKQKIPRPGLATIEEKGGGGFRGKFILHAKDGGSATVRTTKEVYRTAQEAQDAAAVLGLFVVAGDRRMDRLMPAEFVPLWKEAAEDEAARGRKEAEVAQRRAEQGAREARKAKREALLPLFLSDNLRQMVEAALRQVRGELTSARAAAARSTGDGEVSSALRRLGWPARLAEQAAQRAGGDIGLAQDWLLLNAPAGEVPPGYEASPALAMPFEVIRANKGSAAPPPPAEHSGQGVGQGAVAVTLPAAGAGRAAGADAGAAAVLVALGLGWAEARVALARAGGDVFKAVRATEARESDEAGGAEGLEGAEVAEEEEVLAAIYGAQADGGAFEGAPGPEGRGRRWTLTLEVDGVALRLELETAIGAAAYPHALPLLRLTQEGAPGAEWELAVLCRELYELVRRVDGGPAAHDLAVFLNNDGADARARAHAALASVPAPPAPAPAAAAGGGGGRRGGAGEPAPREEGADRDGASVASGASTAGGGEGNGSNGTAGGGGQDSPARRNRGGGAARPDAGPPRGKGVSERLAKEAAASFGAGDMLAGRKRLPAWGKREEVVAAVSGTAVVVISGETGCGKTTQVPQFILDDLIARGRGGDANIVCTQPRRISAVGVAERVARERAEKIGGMVGYSIRLENKRSEHTRLLFCTTGILLRRMASDPTLAAVSHVIVDEVHERSLDSDFLLILLRRALAARPGLKVVLMSATLDAAQFSRYFGGAPALHIPGFTHAVRDVFLEEALRLTGQLIGRGSPYALSRDAFLARKKALGGTGAGGAAALMAPRAAGEADPWGEEAGDEGNGSNGSDGEGEGGPGEDGRLDSVGISMLNVDEARVNYELIELLVAHICAEPSLQLPAGSPAGLGAVLVFLPGMGEITQALERLQDSPRLRGFKLQLLPLHSTLPSSDQLAVFQRPPAGTRKVVLATNIAETSITIDDCVFVIDTGRAREVQFEPASGLSRLADVWVSQAAARQRRGRAGRVQAGTCFRLFSTGTHARMLQQQPPEMHRVPLDQLVLQVMAMQLGEMAQAVEPWTFLSEALEPPPRAAVEQAMATLHSVGAIEGGKRGEWLGPLRAGARAWRLSPLGVHLARMPVDVRLARMLVFAAVLGVVEPALTIAATLSSRSPFLAPLEKRAEADRAKRSFSRPRDKSDHLLSVRAFEQWEAARQGGAREERRFCEQSFLSSTSLRTIADLRTQFREVLADSGFAAARPRGGKARRWDAAGDDANANANNTRVLRAVICAGLYPNVVRVQRPETTYVEQVAGAVAQAPTAKQLKMFTQADGRVFLHPSSVNFTDADFVSPWLVFHQKQATSKVFIRDSSMVTPYALLLFGGELEVLHQRSEVHLDGWIRFAAQPRTGALVRALRGLLDDAVEAKLARPDADLSAHPAIAALLKILAFE